MTNADQGRRIIAHLKRKALTYLEMNMLGISVSPHKRVMEQLLPSEQLLKNKDAKGRTTWRVVKVGRLLKGAQ